MKDLDGLEVNKINQLVVDQTLKTSDDDIFAIGDCAACPWPGHDGNVPPRAQAAHQQASTLSKSIVNRLKGSKLVNYVYLITARWFPGQIHYGRQSDGQFDGYGQHRRIYRQSGLSVPV